MLGRAKRREGFLRFRSREFAGVINRRERARRNEMAWSGISTLRHESQDQFFFLLNQHISNHKKKKPTLATHLQSCPPTNPKCVMIMSGFICHYLGIGHGKSYLTHIIHMTSTNPCPTIVRHKFFFIVEINGFRIKKQPMLGTHLQPCPPTKP